MLTPCGNQSFYARTRCETQFFPAPFSGELTIHVFSFPFLFDPAMSTSDDMELATRTRSRSRSPPPLRELMELIRVLFISPPMTVVEPIGHEWAFFAARWWTRTVTYYLEVSLPQRGPWYTKWFHFDTQGNETGYTWYSWTEWCSWEKWPM